MNEQIETIRRACIDANKHIVDLTFGCIIRYENAEHLGNAMILKELDGGEYHCYIVGKPFNVQYKDITDIIGRPIRLADIQPLKRTVLHLKMMGYQGWYSMPQTIDALGHCHLQLRVLERSYL